MFKGEYQGGAFVEIFSSQGKDPVAKWKLCGNPAVQKVSYWQVFDKEVKSYVYILEGSCQRNKMQLPKNSKHSLGLIQRFLVLQIWFPVGQDFSTELQITDLGNIKRRLYLSTIHKEFSTTPLHAKIPLGIIRRKIWSNICIDMVSFANAAFKGPGFQFLDRIVVSANCKLRKIFTMKFQPQDTTTFEDGLYSLQCFSDGPTDMIPRCCQLAIDIDQVTQLLNMVKLKQGELRIGSQQLASADMDQPPGRGVASARSARNQDISHIAFGSKVSGPPPAISKKVGTTAPKDLSIVLDSKATKSPYQPCCGKEELSDKLTQRSERQVSSQPEPTKQIRQENICFTKQTTEAITSDPLPRDRLGSRAMRGLTPDVPPHHQMKGERELNRSPTPLQSRTNAGLQAGDKWHFSDLSAEGFRSHSSHHSTPKSRHSRSNARSHEEGSIAENGSVSACLSEDDEKEGELKPKDVYTYSSQPRSAPHCRLHNVSSQGIMWTVEMKGDGEQDISDDREAQMEDDFHRHYSSEEEDSLNGMTKLPLETMTSAEVSAVNQPLGVLEARTGSASVERPLRGTPALAKMDSHKFPSSLTPVQSKSPTMLDVPDTETNLKKVKDAQSRTMVKTSLKEIPKEDSRLTTETFEDSLNGMTKLPLETMTNAEVSAVNQTLGALEARTGSASVERPLRGTPALAKMDSHKFPSSLTPVQSKSPTMLDVPDTETNLKKVKDAQSRTMVKTSLKEIPKEDPRLTTETFEHDWLKYQPKDMSESDEARMLASLRRQQLEEMEDDGKTTHLNAVQLGDCAYGDDSLSTSSDDTSIWGTQHPGPPANQGHHYQNEMLLTLSQKKMNPLFLSNPRDWSNIFSPPIILPSEQMKDQKNIISPRQPSARQDLTNDAANVMDDQDEVLDLLYDPCLNCYFDPKTGKYYELA
ncbi:protein CFAP20DC [Rhinoraja longicauda]